MIMQAADLRAHMKVHSMHTHCHGNALRCENDEPSTIKWHWEIRLHADRTHTSGLLQYTPRLQNINYPASGGRVNLTHRVVGCGGCGGGSRTNSQPNNSELSPCNNPRGASTPAPVPKTAAYGCHRPKQDVLSGWENYTITRPTWD